MLESMAYAVPLIEYENRLIEPLFYVYRVRGKSLFMQLLTVQAISFVSKLSLMTVMELGANSLNSEGRDFTGLTQVNQLVKCILRRSNIINYADIYYNNDSK